MVDNNETIVNLNAYNDEIKRIISIVADAMMESALEEYRENYEEINEMSKELLNEKELFKHDANDIYNYHIERCKYNFISGVEDAIDGFQEIFLSLLETSTKTIKEEFKNIQNNNINELSINNFLTNNKRSKKLS